MISTTVLTLLYKRKMCDVAKFVYMTITSNIHIPTTGQDSRGIYITC